MLRLCQPEPLQLTLRGLPGTRLLLSVAGAGLRVGVGGGGICWLMEPLGPFQARGLSPASPSGFSGSNDAIVLSLPLLGPPSSIPGQEPFSPF